MLPSSVSHETEGGAVLFKTIIAFQELVDYRKSQNGSWKAEFHGALDVEAEGPTLESCRSRAREILDEKLAAWIAGTADSAALAPPER
jgi:hypothetical protein